VETAALCAAFLIEEVMARSSIDFARSNEGRRVAIGLLALVACDCASRIARVRFELVALLAFSSLFGDQLDSKSLGGFLATSTRVFNASTEGITEAAPIAQFGESVMGFFRSNNDAMLEGVSKVFPLMIDLAAGKQ
jgi:hypothetical protein